jgi:hypothetical protein
VAHDFEHADAQKLQLLSNTTPQQTDGSQGVRRPARASAVNMHGRNPLSNLDSVEHLIIRLAEHMPACGDHAAALLPSTASSEIPVGQLWKSFAGMDLTAWAFALHTYILAQS